MTKSRALSFTKMHGLGNDFVVISELESPSGYNGNPKTTQLITNRRLGIGCDQLLWLKPHAEGDFEMVIYNTDGSQAEMCGNGIRAAALYAKDSVARFKNTKQFRIKTLGGWISVQVIAHETGRIQAQVDMGVPVLKSSVEKFNIKSDRGEQFEGEFLEVSMGNPHAVFFKSLTDSEFKTFGPLIESHTRFPNRTNVEFVELLSPKHLKVKVWERGSGATLACGTGACASAVAAMALNQTKERSLSVELPGGVLEVEWAGPGSSVLMTGPAVTVYKGTI